MGGVEGGVGGGRVVRVADIMWRFGKFLVIGLVF